MSYTVWTSKNRNLSEFCHHFPEGLVKCDNYKQCMSCVFADRIRMTNQRKSREYPLFWERDCLKQTKVGGGETFYNKAIVLSEDCMERLGIEKILFNQIAIAFGGCGCFVQNKVGPIDIYLLSDPNEKYLVYRNEVCGIPNDAAVKKWENLFFMGLRDYL